MVLAWERGSVSERATSAMLRGATEGSGAQHYIFMGLGVKIGMRNDNKTLIYILI